MKTISLAENCPLTFLEVSDIEDVYERLTSLSKWKEDYERAIDKIYGQAALLDILKNPLDMQLSNVILNELKKEELRKIVQPLVVSENIFSKYEELKKKLNPQYEKLTKEEKLLWLQNIEFIMTPKLSKILACISADSTRHLLVGGESRMGKSTFFRWIASQLKAEVRENYTYIPFVHVEGTTDLRSLRPFYQRLLLHYGGRYQTRHRDYEFDLSQACIGLMMVARAKYVVIDEIGTMAVNVIQRKLIEFTNIAPPTLKIIGTSVNPSMFTENDEEVLGRFGKPFILESFMGEKLENLLYFFDLVLPFSTSLLHTTELGKLEGKTIPGLSKLIEARTKGILGNIVDLIKNSAIRTIEEDKEGISPEILNDTWEKLHNFE